MSLQVRPAELFDVPVLLRLTGELGYPSTAEQIQERLRFILADQGHAVFVAENADGVVIGWVHIFHSKLLKSDARAEIGGLVTDTAVRRQGVGRALMQRAEEWTRQQGLSAVSLRSNIKRTEAHRFYEQLGYASEKTSFSFCKQVY